MSRYKKFLQSRNISPDGETEVAGHFKRSAAGYFLRAFFGKFFWHCLLLTALCAVIFFTGKYITGGEKRGLLFYLPWIFIFIGPFCYIANLLMKIYEWKYVKNVVVTNEGVWIVHCGPGLWWQKSFDGKKYFYTTAWFVYEWAELSGLFEEQCAISKLYKLKDLVMVRWDGEHIIRFLKAADLNFIMEYGANKLNKKKKKPRDPKPKKSLVYTIFGREE